MGLTRQGVTENGAVDTGTARQGIGLTLQHNEGRTLSQRNTLTTKTEGCTGLWINHPQ